MDREADPRPRSTGCVDLARGIEGARLVTLQGWITWVGIHLLTRFLGHHRGVLPARRNRLLTMTPATRSSSCSPASPIPRLDSLDLATTAGALSTCRARRRMDELLDRFGVSPSNSTGDARLVHFSRPARAVRLRVGHGRRCAERPALEEICCGLHTGECELVGTDLIGLAVNVAARIAGAAGPERSARRPPRSRTWSSARASASRRSAGRSSRVCPDDGSSTGTSGTDPDR